MRRSFVTGSNGLPRLVRIGEARTPDERLHDAARRGDVVALREALSAGADPKKNDSSALHAAASAGHPCCVEALAPVSDPKVRGSYALYLAVMSDVEESVRLLLPLSDVDTVMGVLSPAFPVRAARLASLSQSERMRTEFLSSSSPRSCRDGL